MKLSGQHRCPAYVKRCADLHIKWRAFIPCFRLEHALKALPCTCCPAYLCCTPSQPCVPLGLGISHTTYRSPFCRITLFVVISVVSLLHLHNGKSRSGLLFKNDSLAHTSQALELSCLFMCGFQRATVHFTVALPAFSSIPTDCA